MTLVLSLSDCQALVPITKEIQIPFDFHRFIIGAKGRDVRKMMQEFDVSISIPAPSEQSDIVKVSGAPANLERAEEALNARVEQLEKEKEDRVRVMCVSIKSDGSIVKRGSGTCRVC